MQLDADTLDVQGQAQRGFEGFMLLPRCTPGCGCNSGLRGSQRRLRRGALLLDEGVQLLPLRRHVGAEGGVRGLQGLRRTRCPRHGICREAAVQLLQALRHGGLQGMNPGVVLEGLFPGLHVGGFGPG